MSTPRFDIISFLLEDEMPKRYQSPKLETRTDVPRPYYFVRVFVPRITANGIVRKREVKILGYVADINKRKAEQLRAKLLEAVNAGRVVVQSQILMRDLIERYLAIRLPQLSQATQNWQQSLIPKHILPAFGALKLADVDRPAVEAFLLAKEEAGLSWWTRSGLLGILSSLFHAARDWKLWEGDSPTRGVKLGRKREVREKRLLSADDMRRLLAALSGDVRLIVLIIFGTGLRISEVLGLQWRDIDLQAGTLTVARRWYRGDLDEPKTEASKRTRQLGPLADELRLRLYAGADILERRERTVPRPEMQHTSSHGAPAKYEQATGQIETVKDRDASTRYVFTGDDSRTPPDERDLLRYVLRPTLKRLGLYAPGMGWHTWRRMYATWKQTVGGATPFEAQRGMGHASLEMTFAYSLTDAERERDQVAKMFEHLIGTEATKQ